MKDWKDRIGSDLWRNLLAEECDIVSGITHVSQWHTDKSNQVSGLPLIPLPEKTAFCARALTQSDSPSLRSYLVFQTGRLFLVGAPRQAVEMLRLAPGGPLPRHLVLLTWHIDHFQGLMDLLELNQSRTPLWTIWTSSWIWEETLRWLSRLNDERAREVHACMERLRYLTPEEAETRLENGNESGLTNAVVACERQMDLALALGVSIRLDYVPSVLPSLRVAFRCNQAEITLDPLNAIATQGDLEAIRDRLGKTIRSFPALRDDFFIRYGRLAPRQSLPAVASGGWWQPSPPETWLLPEPVDLEMLGKTPDELHLTLTHALEERSHTSPVEMKIAPPMTFTSAADTAAVLSKTVVAILCGGLAARRQKALLDPGRRLNVQPDGSGAMCVLSILEWRLHQLYHWANLYDLEIPVLLMTSPDTEEIVREQAMSFEASLERLPHRQRQKGRLALVHLPQQLVPVVEEAAHGLRPVELPDGGWTLDARGHLDFLQLLHAWLKAGDKATERSLCFVIAYNNLGCLFDNRTLRTLSAFERSGQPLGVEMFQLERAPHDRDPRWDLMSYATQTGRGGALRLFKKAYFAAGGGDQADLSPRHYSSQTWYVNLTWVRKWDDDFFKQAPLQRYVLADKAGPWHPRRDLEQVTHLREPSVMRILESEPGHTDRGLYAHARFLVVRTEDHIRHREFREAFDEAVRYQISPAPMLTRERSQIDPDGFSFIETVPVAMEYVWGGHDIANLKGLPEEHRRRRIAETWEVSTHPSGPSSVYLNLRHPVPLPEVIRAHGTSRDGHLPFMVKYLDCHEPLSMQVHPNGATAAYLYYFKGPGTFRLQDHLGKEESFYVIRRAAHQPFQLFLGFERERLAPIARHLRPILLDYAARASHPAELWTCYNALVTTLRDCLTGECLGEIAQVLKIDKGLLSAEVLASFTPLAAPSADPHALQNILRYHVEIAPAHLGDLSPAAALLGREYLFSAIGVIRLIEEVAKLALNAEHDRLLQRHARQLFDHRAGNGGNPQNSPLLRYFHTAKVEPGWWVRIPPGTVHSWQGGGNLLVELSQRSDNTFRLLDFGREITTATRREMHYLEAMYSLNAAGIVDTEATQHLTFEAEICGSETQMSHTRRKCHAELNYRLLVASAKDRASALQSGDAMASCEDWMVLPDSGNAQRKHWSILLNPDDAVRIRTEPAEEGGSPGGAFSELFVGRCRAVLIAPGVRAKVLSSHPNARILHLFPE